MAQFETVALHVHSLVETGRSSSLRAGSASACAYDVNDCVQQGAGDDRPDGIGERGALSFTSEGLTPRAYRRHASCSARPTVGYSPTLEEGGQPAQALSSTAADVHAQPHTECPPAPAIEESLPPEVHRSISASGGGCDCGCGNGGATQAYRDGSLYVSEVAACTRGPHATCPQCGRRNRERRNGVLSIRRRRNGFLSLRHRRNGVLAAAADGSAACSDSAVSHPRPASGFGSRGLDSAGSSDGQGHPAGVGGSYCRYCKAPLSDLENEDDDGGSGSALNSGSVFGDGSGGPIDGGLDEEVVGSFSVSVAVQEDDTSSLTYLSGCGPAVVRLGGPGLLTRIGTLEEAAPSPRMAGHRPQGGAAGYPHREGVQLPDHMQPQLVQAAAADTSSSSALRRHSQQDPYPGQELAAALNTAVGCSVVTADADQITSVSVQTTPCISDVDSGSAPSPVLGPVLIPSRQPGSSWGPRPPQDTTTGRMGEMAAPAAAPRSKGTVAAATAGGSTQRLTSSWADGAANQRSMVRQLVFARRSAEADPEAAMAMAAVETTVSGPAAQASGTSGRRRVDPAATPQPLAAPLSSVGQAASPRRKILPQGFAQYPERLHGGADRGLTAAGSTGPSPALSLEPPPPAGAGSSSSTGISTGILRVMPTLTIGSVAIRPAVMTTLVSHAVAKVLRGPVRRARSLATLPAAVGEPPGADPHRGLPKLPPPVRQPPGSNSQNPLTSSPAVLMPLPLLPAPTPHAAVVKAATTTSAIPVRSAVRRSASFLSTTSVRMPQPPAGEVGSPGMFSPLPSATGGHRGPMGSPYQSAAPAAGGGGSTGISNLAGGCSNTGPGGSGANSANVSVATGSSGAVLVPVQLSATRGWLAASGGGRSRPSSLWSNPTSTLSDVEDGSEGEQAAADEGGQVAQGAGGGPSRAPAAPTGRKAGLQLRGAPQQSLQVSPQAGVLQEGGESGATNDHQRFGFGLAQGSSGGRTTTGSRDSPQGDPRGLGLAAVAALPPALTLGGGVTHTPSSGGPRELVGVFEPLKSASNEAAAALAAVSPEDLTPLPPPGSLKAADSPRARQHGGQQAVSALSVHRGETEGGGTRNVAVVPHAVTGGAQSSPGGVSAAAVAAAAQVVAPAGASVGTWSSPSRRSAAQPQPPPHAARTSKTLGSALRVSSTTSKTSSSAAAATTPPSPSSSSSSMSEANSARLSKWVRPLRQLMRSTSGSAQQGKSSPPPGAEVEVEAAAPAGGPPSDGVQSAVQEAAAAAAGGDGSGTLSASEAASSRMGRQLSERAGSAWRGGWPGKALGRPPAVSLPSISPPVALTSPGAGK